MERLFTALVSGLFLGLGLAISGLVDPLKVQNFLDVTGQWDPSLGVTMFAALLVAVPVFWWAKRRPRFLDGSVNEAAPPAKVDRTLVIGAALFGVGWGLAGYCPGPALAGIAGASRSAAIFFVAMFAGAQLMRIWNTRKA